MREIDPYDEDDGLGERACPDCDGGGFDDEDGSPCGRCGGLGCIDADEDECPECHGDGTDKWNDHLLPCPACSGSAAPCGVPGAGKTTDGGV